MMRCVWIIWSVLVLIGCKSASDDPSYSWLPAGAVKARGWMQSQLTHASVDTSLLPKFDTTQTDFIRWTSQWTKSHPAGIGEPIQIAHIHSLLDSLYPHFRTDTFVVNDWVERTLFNAVQALYLDSARCESQHNIEEPTTTQKCSESIQAIMHQYIQASWMRMDSGLVKSLYAPTELITTIDNVPFQILEETAYPFDLGARYRVLGTDSVRFTIRLRVPGWAVEPSVKSPGATITYHEGYVDVTNHWYQNIINFKFASKIFDLRTSDGRYYLKHGPLLYARNITNSRDTLLQMDLRSLPGLNLTEASEDSLWLIPHRMDIPLYDPTTEKVINGILMPMAATARRKTLFRPRLYD